MVPLWIGYVSLKISATWNDKDSLLIFLRIFFIIYLFTYLSAPIMHVRVLIMHDGGMTQFSLIISPSVKGLFVCGVCVCMVGWRWSRCQMVSWPSVVSGLAGSQLLSMTLRSSVGFGLDLRIQGLNSNLLSLVAKWPV